MKAYPAPLLLACSVCGFEMRSHGVFTGGAVVVSCTGFRCPEYDIQRKYQIAAVDLLEVVADDLVPIEVQPEKPVAENPTPEVPQAPPAIEEPAPVVGTEPPAVPAAPEVPVEMPA